MWWNVAIGASVLLSATSKFVQNIVTTGKIAAAPNIESAQEVRKIDRVYGSGYSHNGSEMVRISKYPSKTTMGFR